MSLLDGRDLGEVRAGLEAGQPRPVDLATAGRGLSLTRPTPERGSRARWRITGRRDGPAADA